MINYMKRSMFALLMTLALATAVSAGGETKEEPKKIDPPFKIDEVKKTFVKGLKVTYKTDTHPLENVKAKGWMILEITELTETGFKYSMTTKTDEWDGKPADDEMKKGSTSTDERTWDKFWSRHELNEKVSKITEEKIKVTAGEYDCKLITETTGTPEKIMLTTKSWYIKDKPGIAAKMELILDEIVDGKKKTTSDVYELTEIK